MSMHNIQQTISNDIEIELVLKIKRPLIIERDATVSDMKRMVKNIFKNFGRDFILMAGENDLTSLDKLGLVKTMDYYKTNSIIVIPSNCLSDYNDNVVGASENLKSLLENSRTQGFLQNNPVYTENYETKFKENEFYRRSINTACLDLEDLKNHLLSINISREDENLYKASGLLRKTDDIIQETNKFLKKYYNMCGTLSYEQKNANNKSHTYNYFSTEKNVNTNYSNNRGAIYTYDNFADNQNLKKITLPTTEKKIGAKTLKTGGYKSTKADTDKFSMNKEYDSNSVYTFRNSGNNSYRGSRDNSRGRTDIDKSPIRNESQKHLHQKEENLNKLKAVVNKTEIGLLKEENDYLKETVDVVTKNLNEMQIKLIQAENELRYAKEKEILELKMKYDNLQDKYSIILKENEECNEYIHKKENSNQNLKIERKNLSEKILQYEEDSKSFIIQIKHLEEEKRNIQIEKDSLNQKKEDLKMSLDEMTEKYNYLNSSLLKVNENYQSQIAELKEKIIELNNKITEKNYEIQRILSDNKIFSEKVNSENSKRIVEYEEIVKKSFEENSYLNLENSKLKEFLFSIKAKAFLILPSETFFFSIHSDPRFNMKPIIEKLNYELEEIIKEKEILVIINENLKTDIEAKKNSSKKCDIENFELTSNKRSTYEITIEELKSHLDKINRQYQDKLAEPTYEYNRITKKFIPTVLSTYFTSRINKRKSNQQQNIISNLIKSKINMHKNFTKYTAKQSEIPIENNVQQNFKSITKNEMNLNISAIDYKPSKENTKKLMKIKDYTDPDKSDFIEINADLLNSIELNTIARVRPSSKIIEVSDGALFLFRVYDKNSILRFDIENRAFKVIQFADFGNFEHNFNSNGSIYLNSLNGLFIITGRNHDMLYFFNNNTNTMIKLAKLNNNHTFGSLIYYPKGNMLICLSGWHNKKVEKYYNDELICNFILNKKVNTVLNAKNIIKNSWSNLPELRIERSECPYLIINETFLYSFFGYNCPTVTYIEDIEYLNLESPLKWEEIRIKNSNQLSTRIKSHTAILMNSNRILFFGGYDGSNDEPIENFFELRLNEMELNPIDRKFKDINYNHFYNFQQDSTMVPYIDYKDRMHYICFDENERIHLFDLATFNYDIFYFD